MASELSFLWLELTRRCQLRCRHCYAESGPRGTHGDGSLAVSPSGDVWPCVFARWMSVGNVRGSASLAEINQAAGPVREELRRTFSIRADKDDDCHPKLPPCTPYFECNPKQDPDGCDPRKK